MISSYTRKYLNQILFYYKRDQKHAIRIILSKSGSVRPLMQLIQKNNTPPLDCEVTMYGMTKHNMRVRIKSRLQQ